MPVVALDADFDHVRVRAAGPERVVLELHAADFGRTMRIYLSLEECEDVLQAFQALLRLLEQSAQSPLPWEESDS